MKGRAAVTTKARSPRGDASLATESYPIPPALRRLFWDYDADALCWEKDRDLVISRVLAYGNWRDTCWLLDQVGEEGIRDYLCRTQGRGLSRPQLRYWETVLGLPHEQVTAWMYAPGRSIWDER
jgi:hypothetical protein